MFESTRLFFEEVGRNFRLVDALDIALVAVFLYAGLIWFRRAASRGVLVGVGAIATVYFVARALDMYLTTLVFQTTFAILLFILVVVFQEDLRRMFERLSAIQPVPFHKSSYEPYRLDELVETVFKFAGQKTGALIVLKGREPLDRHLEAGIAMGGKLSRALLFSIFDSHSPGHDGAVIIDKNRIEQFAAHLPISKNTHQIAGRGTRHSAALGLSERSDALTIVVSEERGTVSVAESGKLREMATATDLKKRLDKFMSATFPVTTQPLWRRFVVQHGFLKILALLVAIFAWFTLAYDPNTIQRTFVVPIDYRNVPEQIEVDDDARMETRVTLSGSERNFRFLEPGSLKIAIDLTNAGVGFKEFPIDESSLKLPPNLSIYRVEHRSVFLNLRERQPNSNTGTDK